LHSECSHHAPEGIVIHSSKNEKRNHKLRRNTHTFIQPECAESELLYRDVNAEGRVTERRGAMQVW
ncbi:hypothetical protein KUCAC02_033976, partial [Chaenocephalus aceratus]